MGRHCTIICAADVGTLRIPHGSFVICADGGLKHTKAQGIEPDLIVGDFDSLGNVPAGANVRVHPVEKDETDSFLAAKYGMAQGCTEFLIYGALGGRFDHTLANVQLLHFLCEKGCRGTLVGADGTHVTVIKNETLRFDERLRGSIGVFSLCDESRGVSIKGFRFEAENITLNNRTSLCASNEFCGKAGTVHVEDGVLLITWKEQTT